VFTGARAAPTPAVEQILDAEQAFAQAVAQTGIVAAFRRFAAPDAVLFTADPTPAAVALTTARWPGELSWRAQFVGVAGSGDLAFSAGPSLLKTGGESVGGFYLTVWRRLPDRSWRFVLDHGVDMPAAIFAAAPQPLTVVQTEPPPGPPSQEGVREADGALNLGLMRQAGTAFEARLDDQAILIRTNRPVAVGKRRALTLVQSAPPIVEAYTLGAGLSADGTFGYAYGRARWSMTSAMQTGYYVRVWRSTPQGWRLLAEQLAER
jgi:ketosteroid isomerase-like protein